MRVVFYAGIGYDKHGNAIPSLLASEKIREALLETCKRFGGCTLTRGRGAWIDDKGNLITEECVTITVERIEKCADGSPSFDSWTTVAEHAEFLRDLLSQSSVVTSIQASAVRFI
jgi:hypothetical protein